MEMKLNLSGWKIGPVSENVYPTIEKRIYLLS